MKKGGRIFINPVVLYELRVVFVPDLGLGPFTSRFAHDVVLLLASALCLAHGLRPGRERVAWLLIGEVEFVVGATAAVFLITLVLVKAIRDGNWW